MKTKTVKKVTVLLTAVLFVVGAASFALAASAKSTGDIACPLMDKMTLAKLDLTQAQIAKINALCEQHMQAAQTRSTDERAAELPEWIRIPNVHDRFDFKY